MQIPTSPLTRFLLSRKDEEQIPRSAKTRRKLRKEKVESLQISAADGGQAEISIDRKQKAGADPYAL